MTFDLHVEGRDEFHYFNNEIFNVTYHFIYSSYIVHDLMPKIQRMDEMLDSLEVMFSIVSL